MAAKDTKDTKKPVKGKHPPLRAGLKREIVAILLIFFAIFLALSLFDIGGALGRGLTTLFLGLFGVGAFILPFAIGTFAVILLLNRHKDIGTARFIMSGALFVIIASLVHMAGFTRPEDYSFGQYLGHAFRNAAWSNGGILGAAVSGLFVWMIGSALTYVLLIVVSAILFIIISGRSIFAMIQNLIEKVRNQRSEVRNQRPEEEEYVYEPPVERPLVVAPAPKAVGRLVYDLKPEETPEVAEAPDEPIVLVKEEIIGRRPASVVPKSALPKNIVLQEDEEEVADSPPFEPEEELPEVEFSIRGMIEGAEPVAEAPEEELPPWEIPRHSELDAESPPKPAAIEEEYIFPPVELLKENSYQPSLSSQAQIMENAKKLEDTLASFGVKARVVEVSKGPTVTRYELSPGSGVKVSKISGLADDLALNLAAETIRVEAPIPGKSVVGIEIPNKDVQSVFLREVIDDEAFWGHPSKIAFAMGKDIAGNIVVADIARMPHLLIAGATGSGKSVCINTLIMSIIYKSTPTEVKLLMIDPKVVELSVYNGIPHLLIPVVTDPKKASGALSWAVREMENRYNLFAESRVRDLAGYNNYLNEQKLEKLPQIVIIIDELADLMMTCGKEVEESICRLAQKARAAGIHLIVATQRPSVDVITGLIKANVPSRLAFAVSSGTDSRTILDMTGAEKLLGKGDMLFSPVGLSKPRRIQGSFVSDKEVENIVSFIKQDGETSYSEEMIEKITAAPEIDEFSAESDPLIEDAIAFVVEREKASTSMLQRKFRIGYNRAARMMEELEGRGLVGPEDGAKPRKVLMTPYQHREYLQRRQEAVDAQIKSGDY
ncbi:MAG: DNA translocase FtsK [Clostridiales bacterium]|jgi:S-DNA-T family DNA segregation ATPase FtsK/SpoIIIE|nr:DNA translocase FtsK [Clostridiales bacterium]